MSFKIADKTGAEFWVCAVPDVDPNPNGWYCEIYADEDRAQKIDDFVVHPGDIYGYYQLSEDEEVEAVRDFVQATYAQIALDKDFIF